VFLEWLLGSPLERSLKEVSAYEGLLVTAILAYSANLAAWRNVQGQLPKMVNNNPK
jgi:hypothetical protein